MHSSLGDRVKLHLKKKKKQYVSIRKKLENTTREHKKVHIPTYSKTTATTKNKDTNKKAKRTIHRMYENNCKIIFLIKMYRIYKELLQLIDKKTTQF